MNQFFCILLISLLLPTMSQAADLLRLRPDFSRSDWQELLIPGGARHPEARGNSLEFFPGSTAVSQRFPLTAGTIQIKGNTSGALGVRLRFFRGSHEAATVPVKCPGGDFSVETPVSRLSAECSSFTLELENPGTSAVRLNFIELCLATAGAQLTGDPLFRNALGRDHWIVRGSGKDWDNLNYSSKTSRVRLLPSCGPAGGGLLELTNTATVMSPVFPYAGEKVTVGAWIRQENMVKGKNQPNWAHATIQLIQFNRNGKEIGHRDLMPISPGNRPWQFYMLTLNPGSISRQTESFGIYIRVFEGARGKLNVGMVSVIRHDGSRRRTPYNAKQAVVKIDASRPGKVYTPIWQAADMSYASDIGHKSMRSALAEIRKAGIRHLRLREFMQGLRIVKKLSQDGTFELDFTLADERLDYVVRELGFDLTVTVESTPDQLSVKPTGNRFVFANNHPPRDAKVWGNIVKAAVRHWIRRYGRDTVARWSFECWNEPNASAFFKGTEDEFTEIFGAYLEALTDIEDEEQIDLKIGTMSAAGPTPWFFNIFEKARSLGKLDRIDFISFHLYSGFVSSLEAFPNGIAMMRRIAAQYPPMDRRPVYLTEYNANTMPDRKLDEATEAAFNVRAVRSFLDAGIERAYFFSVCDFLWGGNKKLFKGGLGLFTAGGIPKPAFNSVVLLNRLTDSRRLPVRSSNDPFDAIAGVAKDGTVRILLTGFDETQPDSAATAKVRLELDWSGRSRRISPQMIRVDSRHANSFAAYRKAGEPIAAGQPDLEPFRNAGKMKSEPLKNFRFSGNKLLIQLEPELNSLTCVEILPERTSGLR